MGSVMKESQQCSRGERLSAAVDGEGFDGIGAVDDADNVLAALGSSDRALWSEYHLIGDALRSDDLAMHPAASDAFLRGFSARLATEPNLLAPAHADRSRRSRSVQRFALLGRRVVPSLAVAAAAATLTWIVVPQMQRVNSPAPLQTAAVATRHDAVQTVAMTGAPDSSDAGDVNIIRDARLDQYLEAHQQFAQQPVVPDSALFVRAAALTSRGQ
ncbi:MAG TPA: sigma-E factor negative regulatory protein [Trinickia sp.]|jgi:sigma-E factor negative regulatory protein RseA|nr:sigma-E factor negative regulatory protein [Trinickia sp.]